MCRGAIKCQMALLVGYIKWQGALENTVGKYRWTSMSLFENGIGKLCAMRCSNIIVEIWKRLNRCKYFCKVKFGILFFQLLSVHVTIEKAFIKYHMNKLLGMNPSHVSIILEISHSNTFLANDRNRENVFFLLLFGIAYYNTMSDTECCKSTTWFPLLVRNKLSLIRFPSPRSWRHLKL